MKRNPVTLESLLARSSSTRRGVLEALLRAFGLDPRRSPTSEELIQKDRRPAWLSSYPITTGLMLRLLEISPKELARYEGHRAPKDIAAHAIVRSFTHDRKALRRMAKTASWMNISLRPAEEELRLLLGHRLATVRRTAAKHLEWQESPQVSALLGHLDRWLRDPETLRLGLNDIKHLVNGIFSRLRAFVESGKPELARAALGKLWMIGDMLIHCRDRILKAGSHPNAEVRHWSVMAVKSTLKPHSTVDHFLLTRAFDRSRRSRTREEAAYALEVQERPLDFWREWLLTMSAKGPPRDRAQAVRLLGLVKERSDWVEAALLRATRDPHSSVRQASAKTLARRDLGPEAGKRMIEMLEDRVEGVALAAAEALIPGGATRRVREVLASGLNSREVESRLAALAQVRRLGKEGKFAFNAVRSCLRHPDVNVSNWAMDALQGMGRAHIPEVKRLAREGPHLASRYAKWILTKAPPG